MQAEHPQVEQLSAFALGRLEAPDLDAIENHLAECPTCCDTLNQIKEDTFVGLVRGARDKSDLPGTAAAQSAQPLAEAATQALASTPPSGPPTEPATSSPADIPAELANHPKYRIEELLGIGGMGAVYKAEHRLMQRSVALKVINPKFIQSKQAVERFRREVQAAGSLHHPNIVHAYDAEQAGDLHYLVMEYVKGTDLQKVVEQRGPLPVAEACEYIRQAALGLQHAHESRMVHRDIKPQNLMVSDGARSVSEGSDSPSLTLRAPKTVKILDFGLASLTADAETTEADQKSKIENQKSGLTQAGSLMGTPDYMAPEQAKDPHAADIRSDIYSLGCTLYALLAGKVPFPGGTAMDKVIAQSERQPRPISDYRKDMPAALAKVLDKMMAKNPANRYQAPAEVANALARLSTLGSRTVGEGRSRRKTLVAVFAAAAAAVLLGGIIYITTDNGQLIINTQVNDVKIVLSKGGQEVEVIDLKTDSKVRRLRTGKYEVELRGNTTGVSFDPQDGFTMRRWGEVIVKVTRKAEIAKANNGQPSLAIAPFDSTKAKEYQESWARHLDVDVEVANSLGMKLRLIPSGEFQMGSGPDEEKKLREDMAKRPELEPWTDAPDSETPQHLVKLTKPYRIAAHEVSVAQFRQFVEAAKYKTDAEKDGKGGQIIDRKLNAFVHDPKTSWRSPGSYQARDDHPVTQVSWNDAEAFCKWLSDREDVKYRLPTEAEWEFACRAGSAGRYSFGDDAGKAAQWIVAAQANPEPVGSRKPNAFGLFDMEGNAWEWCADRFKPRYTGWEQTDPIGPDDKGPGTITQQRSHRGGAFTATTLLCRTAIRLGDAPRSRTVDTGFRVVMVGDLRRAAKIEAAAKVAEAYLKLVDQGDYAKCWEQSAPFVHKTINKNNFVRLSEQTLKPLGKLISRTVVRRKYETILPNLPDGEYVSIVYQSQFANAKNMAEVVIPVLEKDGQWRVSVFLVQVTAPQESDNELIQGTWRPVSGEIFGTPVPKEIFDAVKPTMTFSADKIIWKGNPSPQLLKLIEGLADKAPVPFPKDIATALTTGVEGVYHLDPTKTPKTIDAFSVGTVRKTMLGIYTLEGDTLKLCLIYDPERVDQRPTEFATKAGVLRPLVVLKRDPAGEKSEK